MLKSLFASNVIAMFPEDEFDIQMESFCEYFKGELKEFTKIASTSSHRKKDGLTSADLKASYSVQTSECKYLMAIKIVVADTADTGEGGIHSLYIIEEENYASEFAYWGGNVWESGIWLE